MSSGYAIRVVARIFLPFGIIVGKTPILNCGYVHTIISSSSATCAGECELSELVPVFQAVARYFSVLGDPMRLHILYTLCSGELSVGEVVERTGGTQTNVSRHLKLMHERGALARRKNGSLVYYSVADQAMVEICRSVCQRVVGEIASTQNTQRGLQRNLRSAIEKFQ